MNRLKSLTKSIASDSFIKTGILFFIATMIANVINYIFQITMGRMLPVDTYGEMNSLFAFMMWFSMIISPLTMYFSRDSARLQALHKLHVFHLLVAHAYKKIALFFIVIIIGVSLFTPLISKYMHVKNYEVILIFLLLIPMIVSTINTGFFQGLHDFKILSLLLMSGSAFKLLFTVVLVFLGFALDGVLYGMLLCYVTTAIISHVGIKHFYLKKIDKKDEAAEFGDIKTYLIPMIIANFIYGGLNQADMVLVKHFFSSYDAGIYSSASVLGKAVMYLPGALVLSLFPMVSAENAKEKDTLHLLFKAIGLNIVISGSGVLILNVFPELIIKIFFGIKYLPAVKIVGYFAFAMFPMGMIVILMNYFLALGKVKFVYPLAISLIMEVVGVYLYHDSIEHVLTVILASGIFSLIIFGFFVFYEHKNVNFNKGGAC